MEQPTPKSFIPLKGSFQICQSQTSTEELPGYLPWELPGYLPWESITWLPALGIHPLVTCPWGEMLGAPAHFYPIANLRLFKAVC